MLLVAEFSADEDVVSCDSCGVDNLDPYEARFVSYHGEAENGYYCDDCYPACSCPNCDPDYYNDLRDDR